MNKEHKWHILTIIAMLLLSGVILVSAWSVLHIQDLSKQIQRRDNIKYGVATWYAKGLYKSGDKFTGNRYTCASDYFPRYSMLLVKNMVNNKSVVVWVNDTHECTDIMIDLSRRAFKDIALLKTGKIVVQIINIGIVKDPDPVRFGKVNK